MATRAATRSTCPPQPCPPPTSMSLPHSAKDPQAPPSPCAAPASRPRPCFLKLKRQVKLAYAQCRPHQRVQITNPTVTTISDRTSEPSHPPSALPPPYRAPRSTLSRTHTTVMRTRSQPACIDATTPPSQHC
ncbi:hypothetical protein OH77DRAFT_493104 [Trametes cingulata]|nr:hypothetical protein OH77DRAFT_493104 [Trametes cingulata]